VGIFGKGKTTRLSPSMIFDISRFHREGLPKKEIAELVGVKPRTLRWWIQKGREGKGELYRQVYRIFETGDWVPPEPEEVPQSAEMAVSELSYDTNDPWGVLKRDIRLKKAQGEFVAADSPEDLGATVLEFEHDYDGVRRKGTRRFVDSGGQARRWLDAAEAD